MARSATVRSLAPARETIERHEGTAEELPDGRVMGVFGNPVAHEDDARAQLLPPRRSRGDVVGVDPDDVTSRLERVLQLVDEGGVPMGVRDEGVEPTVPSAAGLLGVYHGISTAVTSSRPGGVALHPTHTNFTSVLGLCTPIETFALTEGSRRGVSPPRYGLKASSWPFPGSVGLTRAGARQRTVKWRENEDR